MKIKLLASVWNKNRDRSVQIHPLLWNLLGDLEQVTVSPYYYLPLEVIVRMKGGNNAHGHELLGGRERQKCCWIPLCPFLTCRVQGRESYWTLQFQP